MKKGFTFFEFIMVMGALIVFALLVLLLLNPAQILAESRDTQRISDLESIKDAIGLMFATAPSVPGFYDGPFCTISGCEGASEACGGFSGQCMFNQGRALDGTGWVGIDLMATEGGSSLATLPIDPRATLGILENPDGYYYAYKGNNAHKTYELHARLESKKFRATMMNDMGDQNDCSEAGLYQDMNCWYEAGIDPGLDL